MSDVTAVRVHASAAVALMLASIVTLGAFGWPFIFQPGGGVEASSHGNDAPWIFALILPLLAAIVLAELNAGGIDSKAIALLGMLSAVGGALRALSPGVAGLEPSFALIMLGGRVFGRGFGFVQGCLSLFIGALITGGVGPWLPFQMMAAGWVGFLSGCLPRRQGRFEVVTLAVLGFGLGLLYGALMNLWFWPFGQYGDGLSFTEGASTATNLAAYARYYVTTSVVWDLARGIFTFLLVLLVGTPLLRALRRVSRLAAFNPDVRFER
ncbi:MULTISPECIES: ECF transporter S component [unclassified Nocardioides]|uniref:ECF transporter S component n=1 Tax=unclassified Nocardioides TaxID=2615069 RepID=UPI0007002A70|nr:MULTISPECIES: ECF transporter S component [unclassified Nocardioides]KQY64576.1 ABC transporter permease [Nocardioides sp. Root140]KQZ70499.1 ABC transporter permease [Nocardioides sp. Root151]KRF20769.1 ABC transporter permease [Nocardioides sp. Soil796]